VVPPGVQRASGGTNIQTIRPSGEVVKKPTLQAALRIALIIGSAATLSGCANWWAVQQFQPSPLGGHTKGTLSMAMFPASAADLSALDAQTDSETAVAVRRHCAARPTATGPQPLGGVLPVLLGTLAKSAVQVWLDGQVRRAEAIATAATASTGLTVALDPQDVKMARCLVVMRTSQVAAGEATAPPDLSMVLRVLPSALPQADASALRVQPVYVRLRRSAAVPRDEPQPKMRVSVALVLRAFAQPRDGLTRLAVVGEAVVQIADVALGPHGAAQCADCNCPTSELLPLPLARGPISLSIAIAEQGRTGLDVKAVSSDLKALRDAMGPAIGDAVKDLVD
jgi:hypothetical protein